MCTFSDSGPDSVATTGTHSDADSGAADPNGVPDDNSDCDSYYRPDCNSDRNSDPHSDAPSDPDSDPDSDSLVRARLKAFLQSSGLQSPEAHYVFGFM